MNLKCYFRCASYPVYRDTRVRSTLDVELYLYK